MGGALGINRDLAVTYGRGKSRQAMGVTSAKIAKLRQARLSAPTAQLEPFTETERASLAD